MRDNELYHYGRLGMKWGQHIYLNKYGGLTNSGHKKVRQIESEHDKISRIPRLSTKGVKRKSELEKQYEQLTGRSINDRTPISQPSPAYRIKPLHDLTNEELQTYNTRKQLETTYLSYQPKPQISKGKQFVNLVMHKVIEPVAIDVGKRYLNKVASDKLNIKTPPPAKAK